MGAWSNIAAVGAGAACGAWLRWGLGSLLNPVLAGMPLGTLAANLIGAFLMGICLAMIHSVPDLSPALKLLLTTGFLGGLTTFSSFSAEVFSMLHRHEWAWAAATIFLHVAGSLLMTLLGWLCWQQLR